MIQLKTTEDFKENLIIGQKFYQIRDGEIRQYRFNGWHHYYKHCIIAIQSHNVTDAIVLSTLNIHERRIFLTGEYDSFIIGNIMISQLREKIKSIEKIYLSS